MYKTESVVTIISIQAIKEKLGYNFPNLVAAVTLIVKGNVKAANVGAKGSTLARRTPTHAVKVPVKAAIANKQATV